MRIDLAKARKRAPGVPALDVAAWNKANPLHPKDSRGRWAKTPGGSVIKLPKREPLQGDAALGNAPARLDDDGLGPLHPRHKPGRIAWRPGTDPGWTEEDSQRRVSAMEEYRGADFRNVNRKLRGIKFEGTGGAQSDYLLGVERYHQRLDALIADLDALTSASRLTDDVIVLRGTETGRGVFGDALDSNLEGFEWTEGAFVSTSTDPAIVEYFTISGLTLEIRVPRGTGAVVLSKKEYDRGGFEGVVTGESEVLLQRGLRMRVVSDTGPGSPRRLKVEVIS